MPALLLITSIVLSTGRNLLSKRISVIPFGTGSFFFHQFLLFSFGGLSVLLFGNISWSDISFQTYLYAIIYAFALICAQWFYTAAFATGNTALCSTVYSMGFIFPTLSGSIFWHEPFSPFDLIGIILAIVTIALSKSSPKKEKDRSKQYFIPLIVAMLASGALGIIQKLQQKSPYGSERGNFLLIAFIISACISLAVALVKRRTTSTLPKYSFAFATVIGLFFGCCNLLNTTLAGILDTAIFFPTLNIGIIFLTMLSGSLIYKEKLSVREVILLFSGSLSIALLNIF